MPTVDPTPLSPAQVRALLAAAARELAWGLRAASQELHAWRLRAQAIPERSLREDALSSLAQKRGHADGAALFTILLRRRHRGLLRLLVAYETIVDFLDNVNERHATLENGRQLHIALVDALDPDRPLTNYYRFHLSANDGGYLLALVATCRHECLALPSFERVRRLVLIEARRALVLGLNHEPDTARRVKHLKAWAAREHPTEERLRWFELSGGASATLVVLVLLTLAAEETLTDQDIQSVYDAYWPWIVLATTMLDSYADREDDAANGAHSYIAYYTPDAAIARLREAIAHAMAVARELHDGHRHAVIAGCMVALYLSKGAVGSAEARTLARAGGSLVRILVPILRLWRLAARQPS